MKTYDEIAQLLTGRYAQSRKVLRNTYVQRRGDNVIALRFHATDVVTFYPDLVVLDSGGWRTVTTKDRFGYSGVHVYSEQGTWYVRTNDGDVRYFDGIALSYDGVVLNPERIPADVERETRKTKQQIAKYAKLCTDTLVQGIPQPSGGDCWFCALRTDGGDTLGDASHDVDHLRQHIAEDYVVPSLLLNAVTEAGYRFPAVILHANDDGTIGGPHAFTDGVRRAVAKYLKRRLLPTEHGAKPVGTATH